MDRILVQGSQGNDVKDIQIQLNQRSGGLSEFPDLVPDGDFRTKTLNRLKEFQRDVGLVPDGQVGPQTRAALFSPRADLVDEAQRFAQAWVIAGQIGVSDVLTGSPALPVSAAVLDTHFHLSPGNSPLLVRVQNNYRKIADVLVKADVRVGNIFHLVGEATTLADFNNDATAAAAAGAYTMAIDDFRFPKHGIFFPANFNGSFRVSARTAMIVHECTHFISRLDDDFALEHPFPNGHSETGHADYAHLPPDEATLNPSSYASFAQHIFFNADNRFGAGNNGGV
jgi:peptidoglycan hydrolase-like protein with peptidoglycan-binding domain